MARIIKKKKYNIIGQQVKKARLEANLSQQQLSDKLETAAVYICRGSISRIESGARTVTDIEIEGLASVLNVSIDFLFGKEQ